MSAELHLPDLPEVPVVLGPEPGTSPRPRVAGSERLRQAVLAYLPLLLMVALVLLTWWLVRQAPKAVTEAAPGEVRHEPDYALESFQLQRYDASGRISVRVEGERLRHYPDTDEFEIDALRLSVRAPDGRQTEARARQAVLAGDNSVARLEGDARVVSQAADGGPPVQIDGQRFVFRISERQVSTDQPVHVRQGASAFSADALEYDEARGLLSLHGRVQATMQPQGKAR